MISMFWSKPNAASVIEPQSFLLGLFLRDLETGLSPNPFHSLVVDASAFGPHERGDPSVPVSSVLGGKFNDFARHLIFVVSLYGDISRTASAYLHRPANPPFG